MGNFAKNLQELAAFFAVLVSQQLVPTLVHTYDPLKSFVLF